MNIIILGPQGSGKGTQAKKIRDTYHMYHFSSGDALREIAHSGTTLGEQIASILNKGQLVPTELFNGIVEHTAQTHSEGIIFDGYPRNQEQAVFLASITKIDAIVEINISDEEAIKRISTRLVCRQCDAGYNSITQPPTKQGICDKCGGQLTQRDDDMPEAVKQRLGIYHEKTAPVLDYYKEKGVSIFKINGEQDIELVFNDIKQQLDNLK